MEEVVALNPVFFRVRLTRNVAFGNVALSKGEHVKRLDFMCLILWVAMDAKHILVRQAHIDQPVEVSAPSNVIQRTIEKVNRFRHSHTCVCVLSRCICGILMDKPRILVTHQLQYLKAADQILVLKEVCTSPSSPIQSQSSPQVISCMAKPDQTHRALTT